GSGRGSADGRGTRARDRALRVARPGARARAPAQRRRAGARCRRARRGARGCRGVVGSAVSSAIGYSTSARRRWQIQPGPLRASRGESAVTAEISFDSAQRFILAAKGYWTTALYSNLREQYGARCAAEGVEPATVPQVAAVAEDLTVYQYFAWL